MSRGPVAQRAMQDTQQFMYAGSHSGLLGRAAGYQPFIERMEDRIAAHADACGPAEGQRADGRLTWHIGMGLPTIACQADRLGTKLTRIGGMCFDMDTPPRGFHPKRIGVQPKRVSSRDAEGTRLAGLGR